MTTNFFGYTIEIDDNNKPTIYSMIWKWEPQGDFKDASDALDHCKKLILKWEDFEDYEFYKEDETNGTNPQQ